MVVLARIDGATRAGARPRGPDRHRLSDRRLKIEVGTVGTRISRARVLLKRRLIEHRAASLEAERQSADDQSM